ncbi:hypothetical protein [Roseovarius ramblicola]|uniref:Uncharacterized protein n=1 Tax=Roseovarius ramblicola TaxID=2022336 RepID=A0ABV5HZK6_9RHOB
MKPLVDVSVTSAPAHGRGWSPARLFRNGERGGWYDPSAPATLWGDTAASLPAGIGQPVARLDDLSGNAHHMIQENASGRPVLRATASGHALEFDGVDDLMHALSPPSAWDWAHQRGGVTFGIAAEISHRTDRNEFLMGTMSGASTANTGVSLLGENTGALGIGNNARVMIARGVGGSVAAFHSVHSGTDPVKVWTYVTQASGVRLTGRGFMVQSSWMNLPTSAGEPSLTLFLGGAGSNRLQGRIFAAVAVDGALDAAEETRLRRWLAARAGAAD